MAESLVTGRRRASTEPPQIGACHLARNSVQLANRDAPVDSSNRNNGKLGQNGDPPDGRGHLLGTLNRKSNVTIVVSNSDKSREPGLHANLGLLCTGMIFRTHPLGMYPGKKAIMSDSLVGRENR